jgi:hypothetical protein
MAPPGSGDWLGCDSFISAQLSAVILLPVSALLGRLCQTNDGDMRRTPNLATMAVKNNLPKQLSHALPSSLSSAVADHSRFAGLSQLHTLGILSAHAIGEWYLT